MCLDSSQITRLLCYFEREVGGGKNASGCCDWLDGLGESEVVIGGVWWVSGSGLLGTVVGGSVGALSERGGWADGRGGSGYVSEMTGGKGWFFGFSLRGLYLLHLV